MSYKIILADDEEEVIQAIMKKINWNSLGFEVIGYAENGVKALELCEELDPDVVMTDINMPYMDGLSLTRVLNEKHPATKVVILTGFDEFEYAKEAVRLEVWEYILKPVGSIELSEIFSRLKETMDKERGEKRDIEALRKHYNETLPFLQNSFLSSLVQGQVPDEEIDKSLADLEIKLTKPWLCTLVLHTSSTNIPDGLSHPLLTASVTSFVRERLETKWIVRTFSYLKDTVMIVEMDTESKVSELTDDCERLCILTERLLGAVLTIGIGHPCDNIHKVSLSFDSALSAVSYRAIYGDVCAISISDVAPKEKDDGIDTDTDISAIISKIRLGEEEFIRAEVKRYVERITKKGISLNRHHAYIMEIISSFGRFCEANELNIPGFSDNYSGLYDTIRVMVPKDLEEWMYGLCVQIKSELVSVYSSSAKSFIERAKEYIRENYADKDFSLEKVCDNLSMSQSYFSTIFKRETGQSFVTYLTEFRMTQAAKLLLESNEKSYVVADQVGYSDANYFSYVFKRHFGVSPTKYKAEHVDG